MADVLAVHKFVREFLLNTCRACPCLNHEAIQAFTECASLVTERVSPDDDQIVWIPVTTGSVAEFYIQPMFSCVGDIDIMYHRSDELAIPAGTAPPIQLPDEFHSRVDVFEIVDSEFPGYVYLVSSYLLTECSDDGKYNVTKCPPEILINKVHYNSRGPARVSKWLTPYLNFVGRVTGTCSSMDSVKCVRCLSWPPQAADWQSRQRNYGWPDSALLENIVSNGCDMVGVAHRRCKSVLIRPTTQHRLSFSRAEIILPKSWNLIQQLVYHMIRVFVKIERLADNANNSSAATLSNYHIKTLMLWACELKPRSWWIDDLNVARLCVDLLHTLSAWLPDARCPHYFIYNCNLFDHTSNRYNEIAQRLMLESEPSLTEWFITNYIRKCAEVGPVNVSWLFDDTSNIKLQEAVTDVAELSLCRSLATTPSVSEAVQKRITSLISHDSLTVRSCLCWMRDMEKTDHRFSAYTTSVIFLHVSHKTTSCPLKDELLDVLATTCLQRNDVRRCVNARHSSVLSLSQAAKLMKVVANNSRSTVQLIETELSKAYLFRALRCKDSNSDSIYCLANVYLAVLYYTTGHYKTAIDHCTLVTRSQDHSQCSSHVVQGELLPKIDDDIDTVLGLSVFYQYVRTAALNQQQQTQHVSVFTTELFAHYLHIRCLSVMKCRQPKTSLTDKVQRYQKYFRELREIFTTDLLLLILAKGAKCSTNDQRQMVASVKSMPGISDQLETSELVELLQQTAVTCLTVFGAVESMMFSPIGVIVKTDFEALYAYKCGEYERCLQLSTQNVRTLIGVEGISRVVTYPEFIQLMDDDIVSLIALMMIINPSCKVIPLHVSLSQLNLSLYLMAQCQTKLHHPMKSLVQTRDYVQVARRKRNIRLDRLLLKLTERKIMLYRSSDVKDSRPVWSRGFLLGIGLTVGLGLALGLMKYWFHVF